MITSAPRCITSGTEYRGWPSSEWLAETKNTHTCLLSVLGIWGLLLALKRRVHGVFLFASLCSFIHWFTIFASRSLVIGTRSILS